MRSSIKVLAAMALSVGLAWAATPPALINYQGVLRDNANHPLTGTFDLVFAFYDAAAAGDQILVDSHTAAGANAVTVDGGLFAAQLGGGTVTDGTGPGAYTTLTQVFTDYPNVYVEVRVGAETLSPRTRVIAAAYALNAASAGSLNGQTSGFYLDTSSTRQIKGGAVQFAGSSASNASIEGIANGPAAAGYFLESDTGANVSMGTAGYAVDANTSVFQSGGVCAGRFIAGPGVNSIAWLGCIGAAGQTQAGVQGSGLPGGYFSARTATGYSYLGYGDEGVHGYGNFAGGYFVDLDSTSWVRTAYSTYKVQGSGSVSFVQNHPYDPGKVIVYAAPEGDEVAVYTRGTARLIDGEARVKLGETFALVANPDIGLSAQVTPIGDPVPLAVAQKGTSELVVRGPAKSDAEFDYIVWGLRIGFERQSIVQTKKTEAPIPAMTDHDAMYASDASLRRFNALERYKAMKPGASRNEPFEMPGADKLVGAIGVYDPARSGPVEALLGLQPRSEPAISDDAVQRVATPTSSVGHGDAVAAAPATVTAKHPTTAPAEEPDATGATALARTPWSRPLPASGAIEAGEVLALDPAQPGAVKRADRASDPNLVGVAAQAGADGMVEVSFATILEVRVDAGYGAIALGDLLTTSPTPGAAMRAPAATPGTILGKALEPLDSGTKTIRVVLMLR
jgi:hypothetical protein